MSIKVDKSGFEKRVKRLMAENEQLAKAALDVTGEDARNEAIRIISTGSRSGATYERGGIIAQRSAPGEPPKTDRGGLVRAFYTRTREPFTKELVNNVGYSDLLDGGTTKMAPRPFKQLVQDYADKLLKRRVRNILKRLSE